MDKELAFLLVQLIQLLQKLVQLLFVKINLFVNMLINYQA